jgi:hypothetical protein
MNYLDHLRETKDLAAKMIKQFVDIVETDG